MQVQHVGLVPFTSPRGSYDTTGRPVSFRNPGDQSPTRTTHVSFVVYTGTALIALDGNSAGPFVELEEKGVFDFPIETECVYIKGKGGTAEVCVVAALNPIEMNPRR